ncbi:MAG TPA: prephenate dehydrogenase/arogenate dehydrogenase family protein [Acidimicrobiia bacterium]
MRRVALVGTGLIGGSIGLALRRVGSDVCAFDRNAARAARAKEVGAADEVASTLAEAVAGVDVVVVAVPVAQIADVVVEVLDAGAAAVTDVGSVKAPVVAEVEQLRPELAPRFVGGHPMAGSEQDGLDGADADLFVGSTWVLTPTERTTPAAFGAVRTLVASVGAEVVAVGPEHHDALVAVVSHVPQLAATTLMDVAATSGEHQATLLRLAAGGFRDMTRIAAGHPGIWPDICVANREAIVDALDDYVDALERVRGLVVSSDRPGLLDLLERARAARRSLPVGVPTGEGLVELRVPVPDHPGVLADVTTLAGERGINIADLEIAHSMEGGGGVLVLVVGENADVDGFEAALGERGYHCSRTSLP